MKAHQLFDNSIYTPQQLALIQAAFDGAWEQIARDVSPRREAIEAARLKLAEAVLAAAQNGLTDSNNLKERALKMFADPYRL
jgi:hypothetical protein